MKIILHILLYVLTFVGYLEAVLWAFKQGSAKVRTSDAMGQGMIDAFNTLVYTVLAITAVYVISVLILQNFCR